MSRTIERKAAALLATLRATSAQAAPEPPQTMLVVAHPDDEVVGAGSRLPRLAQAVFVYATDGAPVDGPDAASRGCSVPEYAALRRRELEQALALCGVAPSQLQFLGCPDQQAALQLGSLARALARLFAQQRPSVVLTHAYEGGHPDHDATAFAVHAAVELLRRANLRAPELLEMGGYHRGPRGLQPCSFLPAGGDAGEVLDIALGKEERRFKQSLFDCHASQRETLRCFPLDRECFRRAPDYDFRASPHAGPLWYEAFPWGMTGALFRGLAGAALAELALEGPLSPRRIPPPPGGCA